MSTIDEFRSKLDEDDGSLPERWNAEDIPGTSLVGTLLRFEPIVTEYGESSIAVIEEDSSGTEYGVALFRQVLKKRFDILDPQPGDMLGIKYVGQMQPRTKDARPYHNYVVHILRSAAPPPPPADAKTATPALGEDDLPF